MTTPTTHDLEQGLARARPRLTTLACDLATNGDRTRPVTAGEVAAGLDTLASLAGVMAAERRGEALR